jgi:hypothetical protein
MTKTATCGCRALSVTVPDEPGAVVVCHCLECQRRSGSPIGAGAYYKRGDVQITGASTAYTRPGDSGHGMTNHFCPTCGSTVYWITEFKPDELGVAVGAFADPNFTAPMRSVWEQSRHPWLALGIKVPRYLKGRSGGPIVE